MLLLAPPRVIPIIWAVLVYFKHVCICSLIGTPPRWGWSTLPPWWVSWLIWGLCYPVLDGLSQETLAENPWWCYQILHRQVDTAWPMVGIPVITPRGLQGSAQHHLHAAEGLKPEFPRAGTTVHPSLLDFGKGVFGQVGSCDLGMGLCIFHLCWSFDPAGDEQGGLPHSRALPPLRAENVIRVAAVETTKCSHKIRSLSGSDKLKQQYHRRAERCNVLN